MMKLDIRKGIPGRDERAEGGRPSCDEATIFEQRSSIFAHTSANTALVCEEDHMPSVGFRL